MIKKYNHNPMDALMNQLLASIPKLELNRILPKLELVELPLGKCLFDSGETIEFVYFPTTAIISWLYVMTDGSSGEVALVGRDGVVGIAVFMGGETTPKRAVVQSGGYAFKLEGKFLLKEFNNNGKLQNLLLRYTMALFAQISQTTACNSKHSIDQQLCRWLLLSLDRLPSNKLFMTQEFIANMLGVRREAINVAACRLQDLEIITYHRGHITVLDRVNLETRVCECYDVVKKELARLLPEIYLK